MKTVDQWFSEYGESHQDETNKLFHWICIPIIMFSLLGLVSEVPLFVVPWTPLANLASVLIVLALLFYVRLSWPLALGMAFVSAAMVAGHLGLRRAAWAPLWQICLALFILAWLGQFIGHKIEGEKPSFFKDVQFLLIGPLWLLADAYRRAGIKY
jgi:uncharacterized membrane protein YGL010W